ncbi:MAG: hypothetical protein IT428_11520 [Planctomycetaceae bacterium]|nr:hypothetical protein [Planctomycetaceae bacterium]
MRAAGLLTTAIMSAVLLGAGSSVPPEGLAPPAPGGPEVLRGEPALPSDDADPARRKVSGEIASLQQNVLIVKVQHGMLRSFKTSSATTVTLDGKASTLGALKSGDQVEAVIGEMDVTTRITATRPKK